MLQIDQHRVRWKKGERERIIVRVHGCKLRVPNQTYVYYEYETAKAFHADSEHSTMDRNNSIELWLDMEI
ncbi:hypothetical protein FHS16_000450 [Paenibacillus endophyticus]|uniref:Uncharacterized protein n=1 Tax=Paenibacillus endophyticus TaxID=1294268 RepID=A0A7W5C3P7_9BACL|nr:hypothetical protein [Paenibacillus endophyticus]